MSSEVRVDVFIAVTIFLSIGIWFLLTFTTKFSQEKIASIVGALFPLWYLAGTVYSDFVTNTYHYDWYVVSIVLAITLYFLAPVSYKYYYKMPAERYKASKKNNKAKPNKPNRG